MATLLFTYCQLAQRDGLSQRAALRRYREAGGTISDGAFARAWSAARAATRVLTFHGTVRS